ncbi:MAG: YkgJ family cysteine cluster protein [Bacteroidales bacterium]|nr:YkgJ family cysteine cluster protein [Bacteroidales bacterium]
MAESKNIVDSYLLLEKKINPILEAKFVKLKKVKQIDILFHELHDEAFEKINCLDCANCCKSISPGVSSIDIERLAKFLKIKPSKLVEMYFELDDDDEYVFRTAPCPFLGIDNYCSVYSARPRACREYPHTDRKKMNQILTLTKKNVEICPAVYYIIEKINL